MKRSAWALIALGTIGVVTAIISQRAFSQGLSGPCGGAYQADCYCKQGTAATGDEIWYFCDGFQWYQDFCQNQGGGPCDETTLKCFANFHTNKVACWIDPPTWWSNGTPDPNCQENCQQLAESCTITQLDCKSL